MKERILELFQDYGEIRNIKKIKQPKQKKIMVYGYSFEMKHLLRNDDVREATINFLLVDQDELVTLAYFGINKELLNDESVLEQLNYVNTKMLYGKFLVDDDKDVYWEYSFDPLKSNREEILSVMKSFVYGLVELYAWKTGEFIEE